MHYFEVYVQCFVRVSVSNFRVLTRQNCGARAFGTLSVFWLAQFVSYFFSLFGWPGVATFVDFNTIITTLFRTITNVLFRY